MTGMDIIAELGLDFLPAGDRTRVAERIGSVIYQAVLLRVLDELTNEKEEEFERLLAKDPDDMKAVFAFFRENVTDFDGIVEEEIARFKAESVELLRSLA